MAQSTESTQPIPRSASGNEIDPAMTLNAGAPARSFIVGRYDEYGGRKTKGAVVGGAGEKNKITRLLLDSMGSRGKLMPGFVMTPEGPMKLADLPRQVQLPKPITPVTQPMAVKPKRGRKPKNTNIENSIVKELECISEPILNYSEPISTSPPKRDSFSIVFAIESGNIKSTIDSVLEDDTCVILIYENEDRMSYIPQKGGKLTVILPGNRKVPVMYLGSQLRWYNTEQQLMVFVKLGE